MIGSFIVEKGASMKNDASTSPDVVVIATYRRPDLLRRCLDALLRADAGSVALRDRASPTTTPAGRPRTRSRALVDALAARPGAPAMRYVPVVATQGPAAARNAGWRHTTARVIAFTDDDTIPEPGWLAAGLDALASGLDAAGGAIRMPLSPRPTDYELDAAGLSRAEFATANCFVVREAIASLGGFDERFTSAWREDSDLHFSLMRAGYLVGFATDAVVVHPVRPARFGVSLSQQKKVVFDALLFKKHRKLYRARILPKPPWLYYALRRVAARRGRAPRSPGLARRLAVACASWLAADAALRADAPARHVATLVARRRDAVDVDRDPAARDRLAARRRRPLSGAFL